VVSYQRNLRPSGLDTACRGNRLGCFGNCSCSLRTNVSIRVCSATVGYKGKIKQREENLKLLASSFLTIRTTGSHFTFVADHFPSNYIPLQCYDTYCVLYICSPSAQCHRRRRSRQIFVINSKHSAEKRAISSLFFSAKPETGSGCFLL
jgi:hypothetical protein